jgi:hypothetical protein
MEKCTICSVEFSIMKEGGIAGEFGILPVQFCPTCLCCILDMTEQLLGEDYESISKQSTN